MDKTREPKQERAKIKYQKIIDSGFELFAKQGYYKVNAQDIAKNAGVSTGIIYQYFNDKHDIFIAGLKKHGDSIFYPILEKKKKKITKDNFTNVISTTIDQFIVDHKLSKNAHEEIMAMVHSDKEVSSYYHEKEIDLTNKIFTSLKDNNINNKDLFERVHIVVNIIDSLCHEIIYHKHKEIDYKVLKEITIETIKNILFKD